jgi:broad specificity phosphatase PhoE
VVNLGPQLYNQIPEGPPVEVVLVRHAEGVHNVLRGAEGRNVRDPDLTARGMEQTRAMKPLLVDTGAVLSSPMLRSLRTAVLSGAAQLVIAFPALQERGDGPSAMGHSAKELEELLGEDGKKVYWELVVEGWYEQKQERFVPLICNMIRKYSGIKPVVVFTHAAVIRALTGGDEFATAEMRRYILRDDNVFVPLVESESSKISKPVLDRVEL